MNRSSFFIPVSVAFSAAVVIGLGIEVYTGIVAPLPEKISKPSLSCVRVDEAPIRGEMSPLRLRRAGFTYKCSECHRSFQNPPGRRRLVAEHTDLRLNHGRNDYCLNCHHPANRDAYVDFDGSEISADQPAQLCGKCHGLIHRDWLNGAHGRRSGHWNAASGETRRLLCIQCHDPHNPAFPALQPMPAPTLRERG